MSNIDEALENICKLRSILERLIEVKGNLLDPEVVYASKLLDTALNRYTNLNIDNGKCCKKVKRKQELIDFCNLEHLCTCKGA